MVNWKIMLVILLGLILLTGGIISELGKETGGLSTGVSDFINRIFSGDIFSVSGVRNISISSTFEPSSFDLSGILIEKISIKYNPLGQESDFYVSDERLVTSSLTSLELEGYKGILKINKTSLMLNGNAKKVIINNVGLETVKGSVSVKSISLKIVDSSFENVEMSRLEISDLKGDIVIQENILVKLNNEPVNLEAFLGDIKVSDTEGLKIDGKVKRVFILGRNYGATISG